MMTAGQIAKELEIPEITINYQASETMSHNLYEDNPMPNLEFIKYEGDFGQM